MLDTETKRRIDTARDILVGKVPDPKSQVEQITIALIYKFMDDMDAESEELGGKRKFFAGEFARYGWAKLMRSGLGGHETLNLYSESIAKMPENPGIPKLFRDIFKNAYLPYRDPETLRAFLKIIDDFEYDHSERLGDAFEYLLSVLGSQGDAGQFRTPRHIIDFMVKIVDPKKTESVLDPACGTAGFLISSYKHIMQANTDENGNSTLTPDEKGKLASNFTGYDISPDMVRLSLVNMYLHGFAAPNIHEYDTLTSLDRWNEYADVILANPPFMSPKGGIIPHKRFSMQCKRSEVLFVDYMAEHLTPSGRAGIIVPEGVIFQGGAAYKQLRKTLVEEYLVAVISLPQGVFNPYSGVKTSILILDKVRSKRSDGILFYRIDDDGHDLGSTRKKTGLGDLPAAIVSIRKGLSAVDSGRLAEIQHSCALYVSKKEIEDTGDYRLTSDTYRKLESNQGDYSWVPLQKVLGIKSRQRVGVEVDLPVLSVTMKNGLIDQSEKFKKRIASSDISSYKRVSRGQLVVGFPIDEGVLGIQTKYPAAAVSPAYDVWDVKDNQVLDGYLELLLRSNQARKRYSTKMRGTTGRRRTLDKIEFLSIEIPLPPVEVQKEIVAEIEGYQKVIDGARAVVENYKPRIQVDPEWPMVELGELAILEYGYTTSASDDGDVRFIRITDISPEGALIKDGAKYITLTEESRPSLLKKGDILVARTGATYGKTMIFNDDRPAVFASYLIRLRFSPDRVLPGYYWSFAQSESYWAQARSLVTGGGQPQFNGNALKRLRTPLPPLSIQRAIVAEIEAEQALIAANRELITRMEKKIQDTLARVWGEKA